MSAVEKKRTWGGRRHGKSLLDHIREGTFRLDRHEGLLESDNSLLSIWISEDDDDFEYWLTLAWFQTEYRNASSEREKWLLAQDFAASV